ncbi:MAG: 3-deoxy-D-manno-octulosonic-acid transferase [Verrucomicrobiota bacterium]
MIRFLYNLLFPVGLLLFLPGYLLKMWRRGNYRHKFGQRFGIYDWQVHEKLRESRCTWIHAVSVGEVMVALKLAAKLKELEPDLRVALTTTTTTGFALAQKDAPPFCEVLYSPLDFWPVMRRAFKTIRPVKIVLVEAEIWPNMTAEAQARGIPLALVNARLSSRSEKRFRRFRTLIAPILQLVDLVCVPQPEDVQRWSALGVESDRIKVTGSIKYDPSISVNQNELPAFRLFHLDSRDPTRLVLFGGSTHAGEEKLLAEIFLNLRRQFSSLCLFIAPRHVERSHEIRKQIESLSLGVRFSSEAERDKDFKPDCVLLDQTGELQGWYRFATVVFIGKSLTARGGQNPVEPIMAGVPVIFGPHMENFATLAKNLVRQNGAIEVHDARELEQAVENILRDGDARRLLVENAQRVVMEHRGATSRTAQLIVDLV